MQKTIHAQLYKADESKRLVSGIATAEEPDRDSEIMDYESSAPHFKSWSQHTAEVTGGKSLGAVREMHQLASIGKLTDIQFSDAAKQITVVAKVVDDSAWTKVMEGVLTSFSISGRAVRKWKDKTNSAWTRFEISPVEISLVDVPALPSAVFSIIKRDGSIESRAFKAFMSRPYALGNEDRPMRDIWLSKATEWKPEDDSCAAAIAAAEIVLRHLEEQRKQVESDTARARSLDSDIAGTKELLARLRGGQHDAPGSKAAGWLDWLR